MVGVLSVSVVKVLSNETKWLFLLSASLTFTWNFEKRAVTRRRQGDRDLLFCPISDGSDCNLTAI